MLKLSGWHSALQPTQVLVLGFAGAVVIGTLLLMIPAATSAGSATDWTDALFTATSAVCVTGLAVENTAAHWSLFGHLVILSLIQVGGLGIMTMSTMFSLIVGRKIGLKRRILLQEAMGQFTLSGLVRLVRHVLALTLALEIAGALLLAARFTFRFPVAKSLWFGLFHSVSAFCNAGFDLLGNSFEDYVSDPWIISTLSFLVISGGLGFSVLVESYHLESGATAHKKLSLHSKLAIATTLLLLGVGFFAILALEHANPLTLGSLGPGGKVLSAWFQSVTPRTAGFNIVPTALLRPATLMLLMVLMFIGASPGGTGGGIKTTTFAALVASLWATLRRREEIDVFGRKLGDEVVRRSLAIAFMSIGLVVSVTILLCASEGLGLSDALFETVSAFGTVGLSTGVTPRLGTVGRLLVAATMFAGRVGPLTVAMALMLPGRGGGAIKFPEEKVMVG